MTRRLVLILIAAAAAAPTTASAAPAVKIGRCVDLKDLEETKNAGFEFAEVGVSEVARLSDEEFAKLLGRTKTLGLPIPVANRFIPSDIKVVGPTLDKEKQLEYVRGALDRVKQLGARVVVFGSGGARRVPDGFSKDEAFAQLVDFAKRIAPEAKKRKIVIAVEPLRREETNIINTAAEGLKWVKAVNHPNFQLMVDFYHLASEKEDPAILLTARKHIHHFHIANPTGRVFPLSPEEFDYAGFFTNLRKMRFRGGISVEAKTKDFASEGPKTIAFLRDALDGKTAVAARPDGTR